MSMNPFNHRPTTEPFIVAATAILIEGVAVTLFLAMGFVWLALYATSGAP